LKADKFRHNVLIGLDIIKLLRLIQDENLKIWQKPEKKRELMKIDQLKIKKETDLIEINLIENDVDKREFKNDLIILLCHLKDNKQKEVFDLIFDKREVFSKGKFNIKQYQHEEAEIRLVEDKVGNLRPYRSSLMDQK
jgi:hypothetical protein